MVRVALMLLDDSRGIAEPHGGHRNALEIHCLRMARSAAKGLPRSFTGVSVERLRIRQARKNHLLIPGDSARTPGSSG
jgi:hypothetical protein